MCVCVDSWHKNVFTTGIRFLEVCRFTSLSEPQELDFPSGPNDDEWVELAEEADPPGEGRVLKVRHQWTRSPIAARCVLCGNRTRIHWRSKHETYQRMLKENSAVGCEAALVVHLCISVSKVERVRKFCAAKMICRRWREGLCKICLIQPTVSPKASVYHGIQYKMDRGRKTLKRTLPPNISAADLGVGVRVRVLLRADGGPDDADLRTQLLQALRRALVAPVQETRVSRVQTAVERAPEGQHNSQVSGKKLAPGRQHHSRVSRAERVSSLSDQWEVPSECRLSQVSGKERVPSLPSQLRRTGTRGSI